MNDRDAAERAGLTIRVEHCAPTREAEYVAAQRAAGWLLYERLVARTDGGPLVRLVWWRLDSR